MSLIKDKFFYAIIVIGVFYLSPLYTSSFYASHDAESLIVKSVSFYKGAADGQFPPRWSGDLNYGYGTPALNFYYPLGSILLSPFYLVGSNFEISYKILIGASFVLAGLSFYLFLRELVSREASFVGAVFYMLAPYHFLDLYVRGHIGEMLALAIAPIVFYFLTRNIKKVSVANIVFGAFAYGLLILSHNILALIFTPVLFFYIIFSSEKKEILYNFLTLFLGLLMTAFFWFPGLYEGKYINSELFTSGYFASHFIKLQNLIYAPWGFGPDINKEGGLAPQIGIVVFILVSLSFFYVFRSKYKKEILFWAAGIIVSIFFASEFSLKFWQNIHLIEQFQFPWRSIALTSFCGAVVGALVLETIGKRFLYYFILLLALFVSVEYMKLGGSVTRDNSHYLNYQGTAAFHGETTTIWTAGDASSYPAFPVEIIAGNGQISDYERKSNLHTFAIIAENDLVVKDNTNYYPGWKVFLSGKEAPIQFQDPNHKGLITFSVPKGNHFVEVKFGETAFRIFSDIVSIVTSVSIIVLFLNRKKIDKLIKRL